MNPTRTLLTAAAAAALLAACGTPKEGETTEAPKPATTGTRVWSIGGMSVGGVGGSTAPIGEEPMGPDASLAGPGPLEAAIAANPGEPLPEGSAPTLDANIMPDGNPGDPPLSAEPQSPFDPALQNPPPAATNPEAQLPAPSDPVPEPGGQTPAPAGEVVPPAAPPPPAETPAPGGTPAPAN